MMSGRSLLLLAALAVVTPYVFVDYGAEANGLMDPTQPASFSQIEEPKAGAKADRPIRELSAAEIAARIVRESRNAYYATGHPCACPDDLMRNGRRCGGNSAYSRPGGAEPLCYVTDVSSEMIARYGARFR